MARLVQIHQVRDRRGTGLLLPWRA
ncbi:hypothetical protein NC652_009217 [Populus alba x Populus x berolinensis]|uniref:Uncharacterized protein n=1 Tax=Populus alba x Populus x berolinensis TaxID=444605 RepID=A0AAD6R8U7_9ROSI|nr:hypothetical protein NC652_009217 [Populus alba x Populus x berolinensis]KAJ7004286.1 hypothetical protein NC653_009224 [Populus alba x Populus x berolinensis]